MLPQNRDKMDSSNTTSKLAVGSVVRGRYVVEEVLGHSKVGVICRISDQLDEGQVQRLMTIRRSAVGEKRISLLMAEFNLVKELSHLNIAKVFEFEMLQETRDYFVRMEHIDGISIVEASRNKPLDTVIDWIVQICRALHYSHERGVIHFDLRPENIVVSAAGGLRILNFGIANLHSGARALKRSPEYMSPEQLVSNTDPIDHRTDLYSWGLIIFEVLVGRQPFLAETADELLLKQCCDPVEFDPEASANIPEWLQTIVLTLTAKEPADRYHSANAVITKINEASGGLHTVAVLDRKNNTTLSSRFVGRENELERILEFIRSHISGTRGLRKPILLVDGPGGVGKRRLLGEARQQAQLGGVRAVEGAIYEGGVSEFDIISQVLRGVVAIATEIGEEERVRQRGAELVKFLPELAASPWSLSPSTPSLRPEDDRLRMIEHAIEFVLEIADCSPFVLLLFDLHDADLGGVDFVAELAHRIVRRNEMGTPARLAVIGTLRNDEIEDRPVAGMLDRLVGSGYVDSVRLRPLSAADIQVLAGSLLGLAAVPETFVGWLEEITAGNPLLVEEITRTLVEEGSVFLRHGKWSSVRDLVIPSSLAEAWAGRMAWFDETTQHLLILMAVCGRPISAAHLAGAARIDTVDLHSKVRTLLQRHMVRSLPGEQIFYAINHELTRKALYHSLTEDSRQSTHQELGRVFESALDSDGLDSNLFAAAYHFARSNDRIKSLKYLLLAAERAEHSALNALVINCFEHALKLLPPSDSRIADLTERLADVSLRQGEYDVALEHYRRLLTLRELPLERARLERKIGNLHLKLGEHRSAQDHLLLGLRHLKVKRPQSGVALSAAVLRERFNHARIGWFGGSGESVADPVERERQQEISAIDVGLVRLYSLVPGEQQTLHGFRSLNTAERVGDPRGMVFPLGNLALLRGGRDRLSVDLQERVLKAARASDSPYLLGNAYSFRGVGLFSMGRWAEALDQFQQSREQLEACGNLSELAYALYVEALLRSLRGDFAGARECAESRFDLIEQTDTSPWSKLMITLYAHTLACLGHIDVAAEELAVVQEQSEREGDLTALCLSLTFQGHISLLRHDIDMAVSRCEQAGHIMDAHVLLQPSVGWCYPMLARAYYERIVASRWRGETEPAAWRKKLSGVAKKAVLTTETFPHLKASALLVKGMSDWVNGRYNRAHKAFDASIQVATTLGAEFLLAESYFEAGRCLSGHSQKRDEGGRFLQNALQLYETLKIPPYVAKAKAALRTDAGEVPRLD